MQTEFQFKLSWKRGLSMLLLTLFSFSFAVAQVLVRGTVVDQTGEPVPGASIQVKGGTQGTISDLDGKFSLNVPNKKSVLVVSFIGYTTQELQVNVSKPMSIVLKEDTKALDEVVVVGYQEVKKRDLTGAVAKVNMDDLLKTPSSSFDQVLGGRIAGVNVSSGEGMPGGTMNIVIRGNNSLTQDNSPLYVVDGFPVEDARVAATINSSDIESVDVLKDASATSIYGARGANGVVIITTKKGKVGKPQIKYEGSFGVQHVIKTIGMMDAYEFVKLQAEIDPTDVRKTYLKEYEGKQWTLEDYRDIEQIDWQDDILRTAWRQSHNVSLMGGTEGVRYNASASYFDQDGIILNSNYKRFQTRMNTVVRRGKLNMSVTANYSRSIQTGNSTSLYSSSGMNNLFYSVWGSRPVTYPGIPLSTLTDNALDESVSPTNDYRHNPVLSLKNEYRKGYTNNLQLNGFVEYEFMKGLKLKVSGGYTYDARSNDSFNNSQTRYGGPTSNDKVNASVSRTQRLTWLNENLLTYQTRIKKHHGLNTMLGMTMQNSDYEGYSFKTTHIPNESLGMAGMNEGIPSTTSSAKSSWSMMSYLASVRYDYKSRYMAEINFGYNGSENFAPGKRFGAFPAGSIGYILSEEAFMKKQKVVDYLKFRASVGLVGNDNLGNNRFLFLPDSYDVNLSGVDAWNNNKYGFNFGYNSKALIQGALEKRLGNPNVTWETALKQNYGLDVHFLKSRLKISLDYFLEERKDILINRKTIPLLTGLTSSILPAVNMGKVKNHGYEVEVKWNDRIGQVQYNIQANVSYSKNKIIFQDEVEPNEPYMWRTGNPVGALFGYVADGFYTEEDFGENGKLVAGLPDPGVSVKPGDVKYRDLNGDEEITSDDQTIIGNPTRPAYTFGLNYGINYKGFFLTMNWTGAAQRSLLLDGAFREPFGNGKIRGLMQFHADTRWTPETAGTATTPRFTETNAVYNMRSSSLWVRDGSYLKLKNVTIGYNFTDKKMLKKLGIQQLGIKLTGYNLLTFDKFDIMDPECNPNNADSYPIIKIYNLGINLTF